MQSEPYIKNYPGEWVEAESCALVAVVREFIRLLDIEEESDSGRIFHPNHIASCRVIDAAKMDQLLREMKRLIAIGQK